MAEIEVKRLNRAQLVALLTDVTGENEALKTEIEEMRTEIEALSKTNEKLDTLTDLVGQMLKRQEAMEKQQKDLFDRIRIKKSVTAGQAVSGNSVKRGAPDEKEQ